MRKLSGVENMLLAAFFLGGIIAGLFRFHGLSVFCGVIFVGHFIQQSLKG